MRVDVALQQPVALDMRHYALAEGLQHFIDHIEDTAQRWWQQAQDQLAERPDASTASMLSSLCKRRLGEQELPALPDGAIWTTTQLARALLLAQVLAHQATADQLPLLRQLFSWGDDQEKIATLKALDWLDGSGHCVDLALQAGRTNNTQVFAAIALDNPYPGRHYGERAFHQLVLKALGMELDVRRIVGLTRRLSPALNQLALDALEERLAAERAVADELPHVIDFSLLDPAQLERLESLCQQRRLPTHWWAHLSRCDGSSPGRDPRHA